MLSLKVVLSLINSKDLVSSLITETNSFLGKLLDILTAIGRYIINLPNCYNLQLLQHQIQDSQDRKRLQNYHCDRVYRKCVCSIDKPRPFTTGREEYSNFSAFRIRLTGDRN